MILDTYFHRTMPEVATQLPIPDEYSAMGVRRYGAHGMSYESIVYQLQPDVPEKLIVGAPWQRRVDLSDPRWRVYRHFDGADSDRRHYQRHADGRHRSRRAAVYSAQDCGDEGKRDEAADQLETVVSKKAGLLGMSELSNDMRDLREAIAQGNAKARLAVDKFYWTIARWIGSYVAELNGLDMLVFTGGIGENDIASRAEICAGLGALGIVVDAKRNNGSGATVISAENSPVTVRVIPLSKIL